MWMCPTKVRIVPWAGQGHPFPHASRGWATPQDERGNCHTVSGGGRVREQGVSQVPGPTARLGEQPTQPARSSKLKTPSPSLWFLHHHHHHLNQRQPVIPPTVMKGWISILYPPLFRRPKVARITGLVLAPGPLPGTKNLCWRVYSGYRPRLWVRYGPLIRRNLASGL